VQQLGAVVVDRQTVEPLIAHGREHGLPHYAQFDNDTIFQGAHQWPESFGRVTRLCLQLGIIPVFAPPRETGFQGAIESYNGRWPVKGWPRFNHDGLVSVQRHSDASVEAARARTVARREAAPARKPFPADWTLDLQRPLRRTVIFLRRTNNEGMAELRGRSYRVDAGWPNRLVHAEVHLSRGEIPFSRLRRREPKGQPLAATVPDQTPTKRFAE
jgi:hypothetical protein